MTINPHITRAVARQRATDLRREAAAQRMAAEYRRAEGASHPADRPQPARKAVQDLIPAGAEKR
jgi:hypothetical protein